MSTMPKCQALHIVGRVCDICGFISRDKFLHETRLLDNGYLRFKVQLPISDCTQITAGDHSVTLEGPVPLDAP